MQKYSVGLRWFYGAQPVFCGMKDFFSRIAASFTANRLAVSLMFLTNGFIYANWAARIPAIQARFGLDDRLLGLALLAISIGALVAMPFAGWIIVRFGSRRTTTVSALLFTGVVPFIALVPVWWQLLIVFVGIGICTGILDVAMNAQAVVVEQRMGRPIMSSFHAIFSGGMVLGALMGAWFTALPYPLWVNLAVVGGTGMAMVLYGIRHLVADTPAAASEEGAGGFQWPAPALIGLGVIACCCMLGEGSMADWTTKYMQEVVAAPEVLAPIGLGAFSAAMMLGRILGDAARTRLGDRRLMIGGGAVATLGLGAALLWPVPLVAIAGFFAVGLGLATIVPIAYATAGNTPGLAPGVGIGMVTTIGYAGFLLGPAVIGFLSDSWGLRPALGFVLVLLTGMTLLGTRVRT
ncbi:MAG: MFS transporter [Bacteroidia bacterium]|nr:MFS transporter [Bacteroidia bacterium]